MATVRKSPRWSPRLLKRNSLATSAMTREASARFSLHGSSSPGYPPRTAQIRLTASTITVGVLEAIVSPAAHRHSQNTHLPSHRTRRRPSASTSSNVFKPLPTEHRRAIQLPRAMVFSLSIRNSGRSTRLLFLYLLDKLSRILYVLGRAAALSLAALAALPLFLWFLGFVCCMGDGAAAKTSLSKENAGTSL